jgi:hypothetical protein
MMLCIIFNRNRELNCQPDKIKNFKNFEILEGLIVNEFCYKKLNYVFVN